MSNGNQEVPKNVTSVRSGPESVTIHHEGQQADERAEMNDSKLNIANRRVRPYFQGAKIWKIPGW